MSVSNNPAAVGKDDADAEGGDRPNWVHQRGERRHQQGHHGQRGEEVQVRNPGHTKPGVHGYGEPAPPARGRECPGEAGARQGPPRPRPLMAAGWALFECDIHGEVNAAGRMALIYSSPFPRDVCAWHVRIPEPAIVLHHRAAARSPVLTEANIRESPREVRVAPGRRGAPVVQALIQRVQVKRTGGRSAQRASRQASPVKVVRDELTAVMGTANADLNLATAAAGGGADGRTAGRRPDHHGGQAGARLLKERKKKKVMVVSCDVYRPAAIELKLRTLAEQVDVLFHPSSGDRDPVAIARAPPWTRRAGISPMCCWSTSPAACTSMREMMAEIKALHAALNPVETLFVVDAATGQDAANTAKIR